MSMYENVPSHSFHSKSAQTELISRSKKPYQGGILYELRLMREKKIEMLGSAEIVLFHSTCPLIESYLTSRNLTQYYGKEWILASIPQSLSQLAFQTDGKLLKFDTEFYDENGNEIIRIKTDYKTTEWWSKNQSGKIRFSGPPSFLSANYVQKAFIKFEVMGTDFNERPRLKIKPLFIELSQPETCNILPISSGISQLPSEENPESTKKEEKSSTNEKALVVTNKRLLSDTTEIKVETNSTELTVEIPPSNKKTKLNVSFSSSSS